MDEFKQKAKEYGQAFWTLIKQKLQRFWVLFRRNWKKFHVTKVGILLVLTIGLIMSVVLTIQARRVPVQSLQVGLQETTTIIDQQGEEAGTLYAQKGSYIPIEEISPNIQHAVISTEDQRFLKHIGFDPIGIGRAALGYFVQGGIVGGGSTITQQLAKNAYLTADQTLVRKLKELFLAIEIEKTYPKETILEMYLNNSYFGHGVWGVQDASKKYFNKNAADLTLSEGATLAGMLQSPTYLNPIDNYEASINRRNTVLMLMENTGAITADDRANAAANGLSLSDGYTFENGYLYPSYFDAVINEAKTRYDIKEQDLLNGGYTIHTALNQDQQKRMDAIYAEPWRFEQAPDDTLSQSASVAINPQTGGVTAIIGGRDYTARGFNRAIHMKRQPGSIIKPLGVYAPALEAGWEIDDILIDERQAFGELENGDPYIPENVDFTYDGEIPMYQALAVSKNSATTWLLQEIGLNKGFNKLKEFGVSVSEKDNTLSGVALGGLVNGTSPLEMASAYTVFANDGVRIEPHFITKIVDATGAVVVDNTNPRERRVLSTEVNDDMNRMLLNVFSNGNATSAQPAGFQIAGKTGTTEIEGGTTGSTDQWIVGYTPDLVIASWAGYDEANIEQGHYMKTLTSAGIGQVMKAEFEQMIPYTEQTQFAVNDADIQVIVRENKQNDTLQKIQDGIDRTGEVLRDVSEKALRWFNSFRTPSSE